MEAGRELDALVAEKVMGWRDVRPGHYTGSPGTMYGKAPQPQPWDSPQDRTKGVSFVPFYSTKIADAWEVIEKLADRDPMIAMWGYEDGTAGWFCDFEGIKDHARTAPHAICLAALKAVGVELRQAEHTNETGNEVVNGEQ